MTKRKFLAAGLVLATAVAVAVAGGRGGPSQATAGPTAFSNIPLTATWAAPAGTMTSPAPNLTGDSEPAIAFASDGTMAVDGLAWLPFQVDLWKGKFGSTPAYFGGMDQALQNHGV